MKYELIYVSNIEDNRVDAEISFKRWYKRHWELAAIVYKSNGEFVIEQFNIKSDINVKKYIEEAKTRLSEYVNCEGAKVNNDSSRAEHALKLMLQTDGTSMGEKYVGS